MPLNNSSYNAVCLVPQMRSDYFKLILAAMILVLLRMWGAIYVSLGYHPHYDRDVEDLKWIVLLIFLAVSAPAHIHEKTPCVVITRHFYITISSI